jgi:Zn-dependent peptidase ImmA (M78 family)
MKTKTEEEKRMDREANDFAFKLLLPDADFKWFIQNVSGDVHEIAKHFGVSHVMVGIKATRMGFKGGYKGSAIKAGY